MADTPWRGTPDFEAAVKKWAEDTGLPIEEARSQLDDIYRATPEFIGPSKVVRGPTPHGWRSAVERSLRGDQRVDLGDLLDEMATEGIDIDKELADWGGDLRKSNATQFDEIVERSARQLGQSTDHAREALLVMFDDIPPTDHKKTMDQLLKELKKAEQRNINAGLMAERDQLLKRISDGLKKLEAADKTEFDANLKASVEKHFPRTEVEDPQRAAGKRQAAEWTGTIDELLEELDEGVSDIDDQQQAARLEREMVRANTPKIAAEWESQRQSLLKASEGLDRFDDSRIKSNFLDDFLVTRPLRGGPGDPPQGVFAPTYTEEMSQEASAKWKEIESRAASEGVDLKTAVKRAYVEMAEQIPRVHSDYMPPPSLVEDPAQAARLKAIEEAAERQFPKKPATTDWAKRMPDRLSDIGGASEPLPPSMGQHLRGPIERSLRERSNVLRMATPMPPTAPPPPPVPSWATRVGKALPGVARATRSAVGGALWDLAPPVGPTALSTGFLSALTPTAGEGSDVVTPEDIERSSKFWEDYNARQAAGLSKQVRPNPNFQLPVYEPVEARAQ